VAQADYTKTDLDFVSDVGMRGYYGDTDGLVKTGHVVCELLDEGANQATVLGAIMNRHQSTDGDQQFAATWFAKYAVVSYCPSHAPHND
jgi:hypothetical protein